VRVQRFGAITELASEANLIFPEREARKVSIMRS